MYAPRARRIPATSAADWPRFATRCTVRIRAFAWARVSSAARVPSVLPSLTNRHS